MPQAVFDRWAVGVAVVIIGVFLGQVFKPAEVLARWMLAGTRPAVFRVHHADVRDWNLANEPKRIRCPECGGSPTLRGTDKWTGAPIGCPLCSLYGTVDVRGLPRAVVIVPDHEPTDYTPVR